MSVSQATFFRYAKAATEGVKVGHHRNQGLKKLRNHTLQAITILRCLLEKSVDHMPHKSTTLLSGEIVVTMILYLSLKWKVTLPTLNSMNECLELRTIS
jgi:hypothetical protein